MIENKFHLNQKVQLKYGINKDTVKLTKGTKGIIASISKDDDNSIYYLVTFNEPISNEDYEALIDEEDLEAV